MFSWIHGRWLGWKLRRIPIYRAAIDSARAALDENEEFAGISMEAKGRIGQQLLEAVTKIATAQIPVVANRESIFGAAHELAKFDVLDVTVRGVHEHELVGGVSGVTGEVGDRIVELVEVDADLRADMLDAGADLASKESLHGACRSGYLISWLALNAYTSIRRDVFRDIPEDPARDWLIPLIQCLYVWHENQYRKLLDMPPAPDCDNFQALEVSTLGNIVVDGAKNPLWEWEQTYGRKWGEPRPPDSLSQPNEPTG